MQKGNLDAGDMGTDRFLVQGGLGVGFDEEAANDLQQQGSVFQKGDSGKIRSCRWELRVINVPGGCG